MGGTLEPLQIVNTQIANNLQVFASIAVLTDVKVGSDSFTFFPHQPLTVEISQPRDSHFQTPDIGKLALQRIETTNPSNSFTDKELS